MATHQEADTAVSSAQPVARLQGIAADSRHSQNERLIMSLIRRHRAVSKADIARMSGFSPQTASVLIRKLEDDGLLMRGKPVKGRVGQPSVPMALNPDGALSAGLRIGRRSADLTLIDFSGRIRAQRTLRYAYPVPGAIIRFATEALESCRAEAAGQHENRIVGLGIGAPFQLYNWLDRLGAPIADMEAWRNFDLETEVAAKVGLPVYLENDATCACRAEHLIGQGQELKDYAYFFIGFFAGGGIVMNDRVHNGVQGNAGSLGALPACGSDGDDVQLIDKASLFVLETRLKEMGRSPDILWVNEAAWDGLDDVAAPWLQGTADALAHAILAVCAVIDFPAIVIDGAFPAVIRQELVRLTNEAMDRLPIRGIIRPEIVEGSVGFQARALGAASLPLFSQFFLETQAAA